MIKKTVLASFAVAALAAVPAESALIDFDQLADGGTLSGDFGAGGTVTGTDVIFQQVKGDGTPFNDGTIVNCEVGCFLNFTTGDSLGEVAPGTGIYTFKPGGTFVLTGEIAALGIGDGNPATADGQVILSGTFSTTTLQVIGSHIQFLATGQDEKNQNLVDFFYGLGSDTSFTYSNSELSAVIGSISGTTFSANVNEADLTNTKVPEPGSSLLLLLGLGSLAAYRRRRS
jgi:hypothetical protein